MRIQREGIMGPAKRLDGEPPDQVLAAGYDSFEEMGVVERLRFVRGWLIMMGAIDDRAAEMIDARADQIERNKEVGFR